jgi:hypothetical protein
LYGWVTIRFMRGKADAQINAIEVVKD